MITGTLNNIKDKKARLFYVYYFSDYIFKIEGELLEYPYEFGYIVKDYNEQHRDNKRQR